MRDLSAFAPQSDGLFAVLSTTDIRNDRPSFPHQTGERCAPVGIEVAAVMPVIVGSGVRMPVSENSRLGVNGCRPAKKRVRIGETRRNQPNEGRIKAANVRRVGVLFFLGLSRDSGNVRAIRARCAPISRYAEVQLSHIAEAGDG